MEAVKVSVIIPVYNTESYLQQCLDSIRNQTLNQLEIICIDDGSYDASVKILKQNAKEDNRIRVICLEKNGGAACARNRGIEKATGKYIYFMDSDDVIDTTAMEELYGLAEKNALDGILFGLYAMYNNQGKKEKPIIETAVVRTACTDKVYRGEDVYRILTDREEMNNSAWTQFWRRAYIENLGLNFKEGIIYEDILWTFRALIHADRVMCSPALFYFYRKFRENSVTTQTGTDRYLYQMKCCTIVVAEIIGVMATEEFPASVSKAVMETVYDMHRQFILAGKKLEGEIRIDFDKPYYSIVYDILSQMSPKYKYIRFIPEDTVRKWKESKGVIVYGAGNAAMELIHILEYHSVEIYAVAVSRKNNNPPFFMGYKVYEIDQLKKYKDRYTVIIGTTQKYVPEISRYVSRLGFQFETAVEIHN